MSDHEQTGELPVTWRDHDGREHGTTRSPIIQPSRKDLAKYGETFNVCGDCKHGDFGDSAQDQIRRERFYERLVREEGWKLEHLCSRPEDLGLCGMSNGETMTGRMHKGCDQFRPRNGLVRISTKG